MTRSPPPPKKRAAAAKPAAKATDSLLSVILPTYNEAENLPIIVWLLVRELQRRRVAQAVVGLSRRALPRRGSDAPRHAQRPGV